MQPIRAERTRSRESLETQRVREGGSKAHGDQKEKEEKGTQDLGLIFSRSAGRRIKRQKDIHSDICVEKTKLLPGEPKFCMESGPFRRIERDLRIMEKTFVVLHGLPVFDHSAVPPCNCDLERNALITRAHLITGDSYQMRRTIQRQCQ